MAHEDVGVVALVLYLRGVDEVDAAAKGAPPGKARLGVDRPVRLGRDEVEATDVCLGDEIAAAEARGPEAVRIDVDEEFPPPCPLSVNVQTCITWPAGPIEMSP
jgi:hypothetical protein